MGFFNGDVRGSARPAGSLGTPALWNLCDAPWATSLLLFTTFLVAFFVTRLTHRDTRVLLCEGDTTGVMTVVFKLLWGWVGH